MTRHDRIHLVNRWFKEVWNERNDESIFELCAENAWFDLSAGILSENKGVEQFCRYRNELLAAVPDLKIDIIHQAVDDDVVVSWLSCTGSLSSQKGNSNESNLTVFNTVVWFEVREWKIQGGRNMVDLSQIAQLTRVALANNT